MSESAVAATAHGAELTYERTFAVPREAVFRAWTDPVVLARWFGPKSFTVPEVSLDLKVGGAWRTVMVSPDGEPHTVSGVYKEIVPPSRLVFTWGWEGENGRGHESTVTIEFDEAGDATLMRFHQGEFESANAAAMHNEGWTSTFDGLAEFIAARGLS